MSELDRFDETILDWFADASPTDIPRRIVDAATTEARRTRRARPLPDFITRFLAMSTNVAAGSPLPLERPRLLFALRPTWAIALTLLALALIGAALLSVGASPVAPTVRNGLIAFDSNGDIWVAMADGSERARLTSGPDIDIDPSWSPDGSRIAFWRFANARTTDAAGFPQLVADVAFAPGAAASLIIIDAAGSDATTLVDGVIPSRLDSPLAWAPDATGIAFARSVGGSSQVAVTGIGDGRTRVVATPGEEPAWSPDGSQIAYSVPDTGVFVAASDGSSTRQLTEAPITGSLAQPDWSADGSHIVLGAGPDGAHDIWVVGVDGRDPHAVVATPGDDWLADWSPTGAAIAYEQKAPGSDGYALMLIGPDGIALPGPAFTLGNPGALVWSPDATRLLGYLADSGAIAHAIQVLDASAAEPAITIEAENNVGIATWQRLAR